MQNFTRCLATLLLPLAGCGLDERTSSTETELSVPERAANSSGWAESASTVGSEIDRSNPFFRVVHPGRSCASCHEAAAGWTIVPQPATASTTGPLFKPFDASVNPGWPVATAAQRANAYALVLSRGLLRTTQSVPATQTFRVIAVSDPYNFSTPAAFTRFRRPSSIANEMLAQTLTWDGIEVPPRDLLVGISLQASAFHLQTSLSIADAELMADFMQSLVHAQGEDAIAGRLDAAGAHGGVIALAGETFIPKHNDPLAPGFDPNVFTLYGAWTNTDPGADARTRARAAIARGEVLFNTRSFPITDVAGLSDLPGTVTSGTCSTCHSVPNVGSHPVFRPMNIGTASPSLPGASALPILTVSNATETVQVTDLGRAQQTLKWADLGKFSVPRLRGLASRAPYFHAGSHATLDAVVGFYNVRFAIGLTVAERADLAAFLKAL